jgi:hypothetical protein
MLFANPILTARYVGEKLAMSHPGATILLRKLAATGIAEETGVGPGIRHRGSPVTYSGLWTEV